MKKWTQMDFAAWLSLVSIVCMFSGGCTTPQSNHISQSRTNSITGSFLEQDDSIAKLNIKGTHAIPEGSTKAWKTTFRDNRGVSYNVVVSVYAKPLWLSTSCPVWTLTVNGQSVSKDTKGYGHWGWSNWAGKGTLTVNGVQFKITKTYRLTPLESHVCIEDVSLW